MTARVSLRMHKKSYDDNCLTVFAMFLNDVTVLLVMNLI